MFENEIEFLSEQDKRTYYLTFTKNNIFVRTTNPPHLFSIPNKEPFDLTTLILKSYKGQIISVSSETLKYITKLSKLSVFA